MYFLLDLNFTLVGNSRIIKTRDRMARIHSERYRMWRFQSPADRCERAHFCENF